MTKKGKKRPTMIEIMTYLGITAEQLDEAVKRVNER